MKKLLVLSVVALVYIDVFRITNFETGDIGSATILIYVEVPIFVFLSVILFLVRFHFCVKKRFTAKSLYFVSFIINLISLVLTYKVFLFF